MLLPIFKYKIITERKQYLSKVFFNKCSEYIIDKKELNGWTEDALNEIDFSFCQLSGRWVEIDNMVKYARGLFSNK